MIKELTTNNLLEVVYLLDHHHLLKTIQVLPSWPYGIPELNITMIGEEIFYDRGQFMLEGVEDVNKVYFACRTIEIFIWQEFQKTQGIYAQTGEPPADPRSAAEGETP